MLDESPDFDDVQSGKVCQKCDECDTKPEPVKSEAPAKPLSAKEAYKAAWNQVYKKLPNWKQEEVNRMIANKDYDNRFYTEFVQQVVEVAEQFLPKSSTVQGGITK